MPESPAPPPRRVAAILLAGGRGMRAGFARPKQLEMLGRKPVLRWSLDALAGYTGVSGGVLASYAMLGDVQIAEPGAQLAFTGPRVIEATIREKLPPGFQRAEYLQEKGMVDRVVARADLPVVLGRILSMLMGGKRRAA